jgi:uncharacterized repeat protein (TIGR03803 family)
MNCNRFRVHRWLAVVILSIAINASAEWKEKVLYSFQGGTDGSTPAGGVVFDAAGNLYGATEQGSGSDCKPISWCGTVFQLKPPAKQGDPWAETVLHAFAGVTSTGHDGAVPAGGLVIDAAGNLYGTTAYGGSGDCVLAGIKGGCGTVFELEPPKTKGGAWTYKILYSLQGGKDGDFAWGDLALDSAGNLYGATQFGGGYGSCDSPFYQFCGTVFELSPPKTKGGTWKEKVLYSFKGGKDGANPNGGLVFDSKGVIYGTTHSGGNQGCKSDLGIGCGTVFELKPPMKAGWASTEKVIFRFKGNPGDGSAPSAGLVFDRQGSLYGTTAGGGRPIGDGTVFKLMPPAKGSGSWTETLPHTFGFGNSLDFPIAGLIFSTTGDLIGTASGGGASGGGAVFRLTPKPKHIWALAVLHYFTGTPDGSYPAARVTFDKSGNLYGTTQQSGYTGGGCGSDGCGTVFMVTP